MLTLNPGSSCDVCAEEYGVHCLPHSIPCGHVLCASCCSTIVEKTSSRNVPVCPFCREQFSSDSVRLIRMDFGTSGWSTPRRLPPNMDTAASEIANEMWTKKTERLLLSEGWSKSRLDARRLEDKVARVAAKKCSVEEVSSLHQELQDWLSSSDVKQDDQPSSLQLSAALLRAILMNHIAHSEASKNAKTVEANLRNKLEDLEIMNQKLEAELRRHRHQYPQKTQDYSSLRTDLSRLKVSSTGSQGDSNWTPPAPSLSPPPLSPNQYSTSTPSPLSRYNSLHMRSTSMSASSSSSRPTTPSPAVRSHTPTPSIIRSHTPAPPSIARSHTPAPPRSHTPGPMRMATPAPPSARSQTPAPPIPPKPRRLSQSSPPKMLRSTSEEKQDVHERWFPSSEDPDAYKYAQSNPTKFISRPSSRATGYTSSR